MSPHTQHADLREIGPHDEHPWSWQTLLAAFLMVLFIVSVIGMAQHADAQAAAEVKRLARVERWVETMPAQVAAAYERGLVDATQVCAFDAQARTVPEHSTVASAQGAQGVRK